MIGRSRTLVRAALVVLCLGLVSACGSGSSDDNARVIKWGTAGIQGTAPLAVHLVALGQGYFDDVEKEHNVTFEFSDVATSESLPMLDSGALDVLGTAGPTYAVARVKDFDFVTLVEAYENPNIALVAAKKFESTHGNDLAAFKDAKWGYVAPGSSTEAVARAAVSGTGIVWEDLDTVAFGKLPAGISSLESGRLDIISVDVGSAGAIVASGKGYVVYNSNVSLNTVGGGPIVTGDFARGNPELTQAMTDVYLRAMNTLYPVKDDPEKVLALFPEKFQDLMRDGFAEAWKLTVPALHTDGRFDAQDIDGMIDFLVSYGYIEPADKGKLDGIWDNSYVDASSVTVNVGKY
ncbi:ABC-type nitrate/sulfonate/bicarbonate transport system substrate-binding protein [Rhodococcus sp. 27YEA15]